MITLEDLSAHSFKQQPVDNVDSSADYFYQCKVKASERTLYFINVYNWFGFGVRWEARVNFYLGNEESFEVSLPLKDEHWTVDTMMQWFTAMYERMDCIPDIHNNP